MIEKIGKRFCLSLVMLLFCLTTFAYADAMTALMNLTVFHLFIGNIFIGIFEGVIIAKIFHVRTIRSVPIMILANYVSMAAGGLGVFFLDFPLSSVASINNIAYILPGLIIASFLLSIIVEWPFCLWILRGEKDRKRRSFKASLIVQAASYALLVPAYLFCSDISLITKTTIVKPASFLKTHNAWVYFLSPQGGDLYRIRIDGSDKQKIMEIGINNEYAELSICDRGGRKSLDIHWHDSLANNFQDHSRILLENLPGRTAARETCYPLRDIIDFRAENNRDWEVYTPGSYIGELSAENKKTGKSLWVGLETPFLSWPIEAAHTILPGEQVVFEFCKSKDSAGHQIAVADLNTSRIGLITFGSSPVVVLEK